MSSAITDKSMIVREITDAELAESIALGLHVSIDDKRIPVGEFFKDKEEYMSEEGRPMTYGEMAVGLNFNPSGDERVAMLKGKFAIIIDELNQLRVTSTSSEAKRMCSIAIIHVQDAQMWSTKAQTWGF